MMRLSFKILLSLSSKVLIGLTCIAKLILQSERQLHKHTLVEMHKIVLSSSRKLWRHKN